MLARNVDTRRTVAAGRHGLTAVHVGALNPAVDGFGLIQVGD